MLKIVCAAFYVLALDPMVYTYLTHGMTDYIIRYTGLVQMLMFMSLQMISCTVIYIYILRSALH